MLRDFLRLATAAMACSLMAGAAAASDSKTIRIEPRAFYGATISLEAGVRVFRPLPPTKHMIINPDKTPLHLSLTEATHNINNNTVNGGGHGGKGRGGHGRVGRF